MTRTRKEVPIVEFEELGNLARNTFHLTESALQERMGLSNSNFGAWRKKGFAPRLAYLALKGLLAEGLPEPERKVQVGMRFTTEQLEMLNAAAAAYAKVVNDVDLCKVRSAIHLELAARLDGDK